MSTLNNQHEYWDKVASSKTFTHPLDQEIISTYFNTDFKILDYGCGYGRLTSELYSNGFANITGVDTSAELIKRGKNLVPAIPLISINNAQELNKLDTDFDAVILFAVLTCIPSNAGQKELIDLLLKRLKKGGLLYISDYYLQADRSEVKAYTSLDNDDNNYGVFSLAEGVVFRHHTKDWIQELLRGFDIISEKIVTVKTMNGHAADAFQIAGKKS